MQKNHCLFLPCQHFKLQIWQQSIINHCWKYYTNTLVKWDLHVKMFKYAVLFVWINKQIHLLMLGQILAVFCYAYVENIYRSRKRASLSFTMYILFHQPIVILPFFILLPFWYTIDRSTTLYYIGKNLPLSTKSIKHSFVMTA